MPKKLLRKCINLDPCAGSCLPDHCSPYFFPWKNVLLSGSKRLCCLVLILVWFSYNSPWVPGCPVGCGDQVGEPWSSPTPPTPSLSPLRQQPGPANILEVISLACCLHEWQNTEVKQTCTTLAEKNEEFTGSRWEAWSLLIPGCPGREVRSQ